MSRYRRRATSASAADNNAAQSINNDTPPVPDIPPLLKTATFPSTKNQNECEPEASPRRPLRHANTQRRNPIEPIDDPGKPTDMTYDKNRDRTITANQVVRPRSLEQRDKAWEAERDRLLEEQKRKDLQRLEEQLENSQRVTAEAHKVRSPVEKFSFLTRKSKSKDVSSPTSPSTTTDLSQSNTNTRRFGPELVKTPPAHIKPGGKGIVPQKDAPTSAINAGDRYVKVLCRLHTLRLLVTPETTTVDIVKQAAKNIAFDSEITSDNCLVFEHYVVLGLERRLRWYEHIRDVMNSWDGDTQNQLVIAIPDPGENHKDLVAGSVPDSEDVPSSCQLSMYHSNRPGKWNKRWIQVLGSGQVVSAKRPNANTADKDTVSLCHLSDYDIYTLSESQMHRHIKPPKRFCFAIKSQHKTTLFLNTENFVQYFSTDDPEVAAQFKQKVHGWRSWYIVDRKPETQKRRVNPGAGLEMSSLSDVTQHMSKRSDNVTSVDGHRQQIPIYEPSYPIGKFEPFFDKRLSLFGKDLPLEQDGTAAPKVDRNSTRRLTKRTKPSPKPFHKQESEEGFTGGLLGEGYENRKQALAAAEFERKKHPQDLAYAESPSLLNSQMDAERVSDEPEPSSWFPSALQHTAKQRAVPHITAMRPGTSADAVKERPNSMTRERDVLASSTTRPLTQRSSKHAHAHSRTPPHPNPLGSQPIGLSLQDRNALPKPLIDLTPTFQEPPQWSKDKKGHGVKPPEGLGHLIDFISVSDGNNGRSTGHIEPPPRNTLLTRLRSKSSASSSGRPLLGDIPPVPSLTQPGPGRDGSGRRMSSAAIPHEGRTYLPERAREREHDQGKARLREREREQQEREYREREAAYNAVPGRTGTLKVV